MKRTLIGMAFSLVGAIIDAAIIAAAAAMLKTASYPAGPRFWYVLFSPPGVPENAVGLGLGIPFILASALLAFGLVILCIELFSKKEP